MRSTSPGGWRRRVPRTVPRLSATRSPSNSCPAAIRPATDSEKLLHPYTALEIGDRTFDRAEPVRRARWDDDHIALRHLPAHTVTDRLAANDVRIRRWRQRQLDDAAR